MGLALVSGSKAIAWAAIGATGVIVAGVGGRLFIGAGQANGYSFLKAVGFLVALFAYIGELLFR